jgi:hypothetical protein
MYGKKCAESYPKDVNRGTRSKFLHATRFNIGRKDRRDLDGAHDYGQFTGKQFWHEARYISAAFSRTRQRGQTVFQNASVWYVDSLALVGHNFSQRIGSGPPQECIIQKSHTNHNSTKRNITSKVDVSGYGEMVEFDDVGCLFEPFLELLDLQATRRRQRMRSLLITMNLPS